MALKKLLGTGLWVAIATVVLLSLGAILAAVVTIGAVVLIRFESGHLLPDAIAEAFFRWVLAFCVAGVAAAYLVAAKNR